MSELNSRGHEIVSSVPVELPFSALNQAPRMTLFERLQKEFMRQKMQEGEQIQDEADALEDVNDFSIEDDEHGLLPDVTTYTVSDDVSDNFSAVEYRQAQAQAEAKKSATATSEPVAAATDSN